MRILIITEAYPPYYMGGYELRCKETAEELARRGHHVVVLTSTWGLDKSCVDGSIYRLLHINPTGALNPEKDLPDPLHLRGRTAQMKWFILSRKNYYIAKRLISSVKPDLAYIWKLYNTGTGPIQAAQDANIPTIFTLGSDWLTTLKEEVFLESHPLKRRFRLAMDGLKSFEQIDLDHLITVSQALKNTYVQKGFLEQNITVIPRGVPSIWALNASAGETSQSKGGIRLLFAGRLCSEKAPDDAIKALAILVNQIGLNTIQLDIVGSGGADYLSWLKALVEQLDIGQHVNFLGKISHSEILESYGHYDMLLFPSRWEEPMGGTLLEAMARGLPIITTDRGGIPELITDNENGLIVPANDPDMLAKAVYRMVNEDGLASRLRSVALKIVREKYTLESIVDRTEAYFRTVLDNEESTRLLQSSRT